MDSGGSLGAMQRPWLLEVQACPQSPLPVQSEAVVRAELARTRQETVLLPKPFKRVALIDYASPITWAYANMFFSGHRSLFAPVNNARRDGDNRNVRRRCCSQLVAPSWLFLTALGVTLLFYYWKHVYTPA